MPGTLPLRYDLLIFRQTPVYTGCYPFCLGNSELPPSQRLHQFFNRFRWQEHVQSYIQAPNENKTPKCLHLQCITSIDSVQDLQCHLQDILCINLAKVLKRSRSDLTPEDDNVQVKRPPRATRRNHYANNIKSQPQTSTPGMKSTEEYNTPDQEMKYTFITSTAEAFQPSGTTLVVPKEPVGESEERLMTGQGSGFMAQEYFSSINGPLADLPPDISDAKRSTSSLRYQIRKHFFVIRFSHG